MPPQLTPLAQLRTSRFHIPAYNSFPNTSLRPSVPLTIHHSAFRSDDTHTSVSGYADAVERVLRDVGVVEPQWRYTMYRQHHYHSTTDEVLVVVSPAGATLCFGGAPRSHFPEGVEVDVERGDVIVVPAGVGHALLKEEEGGFVMVGAYPVGQERWDMCTHDDDAGGMKERWDRVRGLRVTQADPVYGSQVLKEKV